MTRQRKGISAFNVDLTKPIDASKFKEPVENSQDCFGKLWKINDNECVHCSARDICGTLMREQTDKQAAKLEQESGTKFLDTSRMTELTPKEVAQKVTLGTTTTAELIELVMELGRTSDRVAAKEWVKRNKGNMGIVIKEGIVYGSDK